jgi:xanthine dehydrogenase accessory factor
MWFNIPMPALILIRGGGDLATGVALRLLRAGLRLVITELREPLAVRRSVSFAEAVYAGEVTIEGVTAQALSDPADNLRILSVLAQQQVPVLVDPDCACAASLHPAVIVDGRMTKQAPEPIGYSPMLSIGLGPGFVAGNNCQAVIETRRGHTLGRVTWQGGTDADTGQPDGNRQRVLRAEQRGLLIGHKQIGDHCEAGDLIAEIEAPDGSRHSLLAPFAGVLRGLLHPGLAVSPGMKLGDLDPRDDPRLCSLVSDKALAIGGGVLEAILARPELRTRLWA